jgi:23S rRNA pseudouridine1911/1915/1917 synthase
MSESRTSRSSLSWRAPRELAGERLDRVVALAADAASFGITRKLARSLVENGAVTLDGRAVRASSHRVRGGELVRVSVAGVSPAKPALATPPLRVLYEDGDLLAVDKPAGLPSEPTVDRSRPSVLGILRETKGQGLGLPHRLDRDTSGVLLLAKKPAVLAALGEAMREHAGKKVYVALVHGRYAKDEDRLESFLAASGKRRGMAVWGSVRSGGKKTITLVSVLARGEKASLLECSLLTGRTHQIRVHLSEAGHPILGDELYGAPPGEHARLGRHMLHARLLELEHPVRGGVVRVESPVPAGFAVEAT